MNRKHFNDSFVSEDMPPWSCPTCATGILTLPKESLYVCADNMTVREQGEAHFEPDWSRYVFTALLGCNHCRETVIVSGAGDLDEFHHRDDNGQWRSDYVQNLYPRYFTPALQIIQLPDNDKLPEQVVNILVSSYSLFWLDLDACVNRLRSTLELLLDDMGVERRLKHDAKRDMTLHDRILRLDGEKHPDTKPMLEATKLVANEGSHQIGQLGRDEVLDCYEMMEFCLHRLYPGPDHAARMHAIAANLKQKWGKAI